MKLERQIVCRKQIAAIIQAVLEEEVTSQDALNMWPCYCNADASVQAAYTMLWYWEADDDRRFQEALYSDVQIKQLDAARQLLSQGLPLPPHLLLGYEQRPAPPDYLGLSSTLRWPLLRLKRYWQQWQDTIRQGHHNSK